MLLNMNDKEAVQVQMEGYGLFDEDEDDVSYNDAEPWVVFRTENEAKGYILMIGEGGCATPVIRFVKLTGSIGESQES